MVAPIEQETERIEEINPPAPIPYTSYMPEVQRVASKSVQRRKKRRRVMRKISWKPLFVLAMLPPLFIVGALLFNRLQMLTIPSMPRASSPMDQEAPIVFYVTATPNPNLMMTATSILPPEYLLSLNSTLGAPTATPQSPIAEVLATPTIPFIAANPQTQGFSLVSSKIVYVCHRGEYYQDDICLMNADGSNKAQLTSMRGTDYYPSLSPDGQTVVFSSQRGTGNFDIYAIDITGNNIRQLTDTPNDEYAPEISPDGTRIVYTYVSDSGDQSIWVMNADGSNPHPITDEDANDIDPSWSPDGTQISFTSSRSGTNEIFVMNADGSNMRQVTNGMSVGGRNDWSADGSLLTFYAGPGTQKEIYIVAIECIFLEGGCSRSLIRQLTFDTCSQGPSFSPDGQWVTFATHSGCARHENEYTRDNDVAILNIVTGEIHILTDDPSADWMARWGW